MGQNKIHGLFPLLYILIADLSLTEGKLLILNSDKK